MKLTNVTWLNARPNQYSFPSSAKIASAILAEDSAPLKKGDKIFSTVCPDIHFGQTENPIKE